MRYLGVSILTAVFVCCAGVIALAQETPTVEPVRPALAVKPWMTVTVPTGINVSVASEEVTYDAQQGKVLITGPCKVAAGDFELHLRGKVRLTGGRPGQATLVEALSPEEFARMSFPYSPDLIVESTKVTYKSEMMSLEATGMLKIRVPKGIFAVIPSGQAISGPMKRGERIELTVKPLE